ncbi:hypothetical protein MLD38_016394 [Melastoma candidum]|uniref:Uncharacterized protein n=1 Tax=Melastoma candidum TaxID=119954 RepID=A0ACB9RKH2_9MYRT|nr:hypothetical protein MLD38_016394 [Melastoma candidum]
MQARIIPVMLILSMLMFTSSAILATVRNSLGNNKKMTLHCRSKDDDLGTREMSPGETYSWSFRPNFWHTTLFYCTVSQGSIQGYTFNAYDHQRDYKRCEDKCFWDIFDDGIYFRFEETGEVDLYYDWLK